MLSLECGVVSSWTWGNRLRGQIEDARKSLPAARAAPLLDGQYVAQRMHRGLVGQHFAFMGQLICNGRARHSGPCQDVHAVNCRVSHHEPASRSRCHRNLQRQGSRFLVSKIDGLECIHRGLQSKRATHRAQGGVLQAVKPAGDGVTREPDDAATGVFHHGDQCGVDGIEVLRQFFCTLTRAECVEQCFGERCEATDVREERGTTGSRGQGLAARQGAKAVLGQVGVQAHDVSPNARLVVHSGATDEANRKAVYRNIVVMGLRAQGDRQAVLKPGMTLQAGESRTQQLSGQRQDLVAQCGGLAFQRCDGRAQILDVLVSHDFPPDTALCD